MSRKKIKKDIDYKALTPTFISGGVLILLIIALVFVVRFKVDDYVGNINTKEDIPDVVEKVDYELTEQCALDNKALGDSIKVSYTYGKTYEGQHLTEDSTEDNPIYEDVYSRTTYVKIENIQDNMKVVAKRLSGDEVEIYMPDEENPSTRYFEPFPSKLIETYEITVSIEGCDQPVAKIQIKPPISNPYADKIACYEYPEFEWCEFYVFEDLPSYNSFNEQLDAYVLALSKGDVTTSTTSNLDEIEGLEGFKVTTYSITTTKDGKTSKEEKGNIIKYIIIGASVLLLAALVIVIIIIKKRRNRL